MAPKRSYRSSSRVILKEDRLFAVSALDGSMRAQTADGHGVWLGDTRYLSEYHVLVNGEEPQLRDLGIEGGIANFKLTAGGRIRVRHERYIDHGLHDRITFSNTGAEHFSAHLELRFDNDFAAMLVVRGIVPNPPRRGLREVDGDRGLELWEQNGSSRLTEIIIDPPGRHHTLSLDPGDSFVITVDVLPRHGIKVAQFDTGVERVREHYETWASDCAEFVTDNPTLNELIEQSRDDLRMLLDRYPTGLYPTGGVPWFAVPFGRDALFTSMFLLPVNPEVARGTLRFQALHQGKKDIPETEEQPGKILHEVRTGDVVDSGVWPHILYGTVDATALFLVGLAETHDWTADRALLDELWPAAEGALAWNRDIGDTDGDGWIDYRGARARNQGWKDSDDSTTHVDGRHAPGPIGLCEVQGYYYRGLMMMSRRRPELKEVAAEWRARFNREFWMPREKFVAQAIDGEHTLVRAVTSNPGHCLWSGILSKSHGQAVARRLLSGDMFSGWGIRTLSANAINYDGCSYHNGSVWPHDCAVAAAGLRDYGCDEEAELVARMILEAGMSFADRRLPELWCGTPRVPGELPNSYRNSCSPQSWAAASVYSFLTTLLGLKADGQRKRLTIAPLKTKLFNRIEVTGLHFAGHRLDFAVEGGRVTMGDVPRGIRVVL
ncbi:MAG TPA: glycogen debranching N-terminal domain-containing protein [Candidatus Dormibacteraeota bacterium]|nr:glycogen debranching N-terminal domain-containing protein [Candidatus Dormibacteraeota bacterium]